MIIYKYPLNTYPGEQQLWMPKNAKVLSVGAQNVPMLWAEHSEDQKDFEWRIFHIMFTGLEYPVLHSKFIGTVVLLNVTGYDHLVVHVFERL